MLKLDYCAVVFIHNIYIYFFINTHRTLCKFDFKARKIFKFAVHSFLKLAEEIFVGFIVIMSYYNEQMLLEY